MDSVTGPIVASGTATANRTTSGSTRAPERHATVVTTTATTSLTRQTRRSKAASKGSSAGVGRALPPSPNATTRTPTSTGRVARVATRTADQRIPRFIPVLQRCATVSTMTVTARTMRAATAGPARVRHVETPRANVERAPGLANRTDDGGSALAPWRGGQRCAMGSTTTAMVRLTKGASVDPEQRGSAVPAPVPVARGQKPVPVMAVGGPATEAFGRAPRSVTGQTTTVTEPSTTGTSAPPRRPLNSTDVKTRSMFTTRVEVAVRHVRTTASSSRRTSRDAAG